MKYMAIHLKLSYLCNTCLIVFYQFSFWVLFPNIHSFANCKSFDNVK